VQLFPGKITEQSTLLDASLKVTVPVAPLGRPVSARVAVEPLSMAAEPVPLTVIDIEVGVGAPCAGLA
jgi:hypothetical protein